MKKLTISMLLCLGAGVIGSMFTTPAISGWYADLIKPIFNPPNWLFGPVWTGLYILMGLSLFLIWRKDLKNKNVRFAFWLFIMHLAFNTLWSIIFFGVKNIQLAFFDIFILWLMIVALIYCFYEIDKRAAWLLVPYFFWVSFATLLNYSLWVLN